jgi:hypothetical protein
VGRGHAWLLTGFDTYHTPSFPQGRHREPRRRVPVREKQIGGSGGSLEPPGPLLEPPGPLLTHLHTVHMAYSERLPTRLNPLAERTCFSQVPVPTLPEDQGLRGHGGMFPGVRPATLRGHPPSRRLWAGLHTVYAGSRVGFYPIVTFSTAQPLYTRFPIIFSTCFSKVTIGYYPILQRADVSHDSLTGGGMGERNRGSRLERAFDSK